MSLARRGSGFESTARAYLSQVHPVFMLPPLATSVFGAILAVRVDPARSVDVGAGAVHVVAIFAAVYTAHLKDGYVDFHVRDEDENHPLTVRGCRVGLAVSTFVFFVATLVLALRIDLVAAALTLPTWLIAYHHAPQLDTNPLTATTGYPAGIALAILGGYYVQAETLSATVLGFAFVFLGLLSGVKVVDDATDYAYDRSIEKRTVAVVLGRERARLVADALVALVSLAVVALALVGVFPATAIVAVAAFGLVAVLARRAPPKLATMLLVRGSYVFLAVLVAAVWFDPAW